jgi:hypothetical protein
VDVCERRTGKTSADNSLTRHASERAREESRYEAGEQGVEEVDPVAAEAGEATGVRGEVADCATDGRGDGLLADERYGRASFEERLLLGRVFCVRGFVGGGRDGDGRHGGLDHAEGCDDFVEHVGYLERRC